MAKPALAHFNPASLIAPKGVNYVHYILFYRFAYTDHATRRAPYREEHLGLAKAAVAKGELLLAGAFEDPMDGSAAVFTTEEAARAFAEADPYNREGLVASWEIRKWNTVIGTCLST